MTSVAIFGASGLIGTQLIDQLLKIDSISRIQIFTRRDLGIAHSKIEQIVFPFNAIETILRERLTAKLVFCSLGTTIKKAKSKEAFKEVDFYYPLRIAKMLEDIGDCSFAVVSSIGASSMSPVFYNRTKGELEDALKRLKLKKLIIVRPSLLLGERKESRSMEDFSIKLMEPVSSWIPSMYRPIQAKKVASTMILKMLDNQLEGVKLIHNKDMH